MEPNGWTVILEAVGEVPAPADVEARTRALTDLLDGYAAVISHSADCTRRRVTLSVDEPETAVEAIYQGERIVNGALREVGLPVWPIVRAEVMTYAEHVAELRRGAGG